MRNFKKWLAAISNQQRLNANLSLNKCAGSDNLHNSLFRFVGSCFGTAALFSCLVFSSVSFADPPGGHEDEGDELYHEENTAVRSIITNPSYTIESQILSNGTSIKLGLIGKLDLRADIIGTSGAQIGDIFLYKNLAVVGSRRLGVYVIDITNPESPLLLSNLKNVSPTFPANNNYEDVSVIQIGNRDVVVVGLQGGVGARGIELFDITNPAQPTWLSHFTVPGTSGVHELDVAKAADGSGRTLAFLGALNTENLLPVPAAGRQGDFFIVDISDPQAPVQIAEWGFRDEPMLGDDLALTLERLGISNLHGAHHSARVSEDGKRLYISYWDGGTITLNIEDPEHPVFVSRIDKYEDTLISPFAHSTAEKTFGSERLLATAGERGVYDLVSAELQHSALPYRVNTKAMHHPSTGSEITVPLVSPLTVTIVPRLSYDIPDNIFQNGQTIEGDMVNVVVECTNPSISPVTASLLPGKIALIERGPSCPSPGITSTLDYKVAAAQKAGAKAVIVYNNVATPARLTNSTSNMFGAPIVVDGEPITLSIPSFGVIPRDAGLLLKNSVDRHITLSLTKASGPSSPLTLWNVNDPANPIYLSEYSSPSTNKENGPRTVHNPEFAGDLLYASWSSDGFRVMDISDRQHIKEAALFQSNTIFDDLIGNGVLDSPVDYFWGIKPKGNYAFLSNGHFGLQVLRVMRFDGFKSPVDNNALNTVTAGQTIPLKFNLRGAVDNIPITNLPAQTVVTTTQINCADRSIPVGTLPVPAISTSDEGLMNRKSGDYHYNWKTSASFAETCQRVRIELGGGAYHSADFKF